jgi:hypothetical protein
VSESGNGIFSNWRYIALAVIGVIVAELVAIFGCTVPMPEEPESDPANRPAPEIRHEGSEDPSPDSGTVPDPDLVSASEAAFVTDENGREVSWAELGERWQGSPSLPESAAASCRRGSLYKGLSPEVRNNLANALVGQQPEDPNIHRLFISMLDDESEDPVWRVYCIQFLALCYPFSSNQAQVLQRLADLVDHEEPDFSGTAMLQIQRLQDDYAAQPPLQFWTDLRNAADREDPVLQTTALSLLAAHPQRVGHDFWLSCLDREVNIQRFAIVALGQVGTQEDLARLRALCRGRDPRIGRAARAAVMTLEQRLQAAAKL